MLQESETLVQSQCDVEAGLESLSGMFQNGKNKPGLYVACNWISFLWPALGYFSFPGSFANRT